MSKKAMQTAPAFEIAKLALAPGDVLVARALAPLSPAAAERIREYLESCRPEGVRVLILDSAVELSVLAKADAAAIGR